MGRPRSDLRIGSSAVVSLAFDQIYLPSNGRGGSRLGSSLSPSGELDIDGNLTDGTVWQLE